VRRNQELTAGDSGPLTAHDVAALVIVRDDGTCTVAWGRAWCVWEAMPGVWPNAKEAIRAVQQVISQPIIWQQTEPRLWEGRTAANRPPPS
jgi:hypothetical protein